MAFVDRSRELDRLRDLRRHCERGKAQIVLMTGAVGVGKTALLDTFADEAAESGALLLAGSGSHAERTLALGVAGQLCHAPGLPGHLIDQATALPGEDAPGTAGSDHEPVGARPDRQPAATAGSDHEPGTMERAAARLGRALCAALLALPADRTVVIAVDDVQHADGPSLQVLLYLLRRLRYRRLLVVLTERAALRPPRPSFRAELLRQPHCHRLPLRPLSETGVAAVLADHGDPVTAARLAPAYHRISGGNPMLLHGLIEDGVTRLSDGSGALPAEPVTEDAFRQAVSACLYRFDAVTIEVARGLAALAEWATPSLVGELIGRKLEPVSQITTVLERSGLLADGRYPDPVVAAAVLDTTAPDERVGLHLRTARLLQDNGVPAIGVAGHFVAADQVEGQWAVPVLQEAAQQALAERRVEFALECLELAHRSCSDVRRRAALTLALAELQWRTQPSAAARYLAPLRDALLDGHLDGRQVVQVVRIMIWHGAVEDAGELVDQLGGADGTVDPQVAAGLHLLHPGPYLTRPPLACPPRAARDRQAAAAVAPGGAAAPGGAVPGDAAVPGGGVLVDAPALGDAVTVGDEPRPGDAHPKDARRPEDGYAGDGYVGDGGAAHPGDGGPACEDPAYGDPACEGPAYGGPAYEDPAYGGPRHGQTAYRRLAGDVRCGRDPRGRDPRGRDPRGRDLRRLDPATVPGHAGLTARAALTTVLTGGPDPEAIGWAEQVLASGILSTATLPTLLSALAALIHADRPDKAAPWCDDLLAEARAARAATWEALLSGVRGEIALRQGDLPSAERWAQDALDLISARSWGAAIGHPMSVLMLARTAMDQHEAAARLTRQVVPAAAMTRSRTAPKHLHARGHHFLATGRLQAALAEFERCGELMRAWGMDLPALVPWRTDAAQAHLALGRRQAARDLVTEQLAMDGADGPRTRGVALRVLAAASDLKQRPAPLREAVDLLQQSGDRVQLVCALADLSRTHHHLGEFSRARMTGRRAMHVALDCGAERLCERLLSAAEPADGPTGAGRSPAAVNDSEALSDAERRVAALAAMGHTNREIGRKLYITVSTVEQHLTRVYRKLNIDRRSDLPLRLKHGDYGAPTLALADGWSAVNEP